MKSRFENSSFDAIQWCDFVRGVAESALARAMEEELRQTPPAPGSTASLLRQVESVASSDLSRSVPEAMVQQAQRIFDLKRPEQTPFRFLPFEIVADNLGQAAMVGLRSGQPFHRQVVLEAGDYSVNVRFEQGPLPQGQAITGQLLQRGREDSAEDEPVAEIPVVLICEGGDVRRAETGPLGEFQASGLESPPIDLYLFVDRKDCIKLSLSLVDEGGKGSESLP